MKIEGAIKFLEQYTNSEVYTEKCVSAHLLALTALRSMPESGEPLSLEQMKQMDGKPVWVVCLKKEKYINPPIGWRILEKSISGSFGVWNGENCLSQRSYGSDWLAYSYPPAHIDRSEWEGCRKCRSCWTCKSAIEPVRAENSKCFLCEDLSNYEPLNFCPHCGRPLTEEAWVELERRLKGENS